MPEPAAEPTLFELAAETGKLAAQVLANADRRERIQHLRERKEQVELLREQTVRLVATRERLSAAGVAVKAAKRSIRPRLTVLIKLESRMVANADAVLEPTALNQESLNEGLAEAEAALLNDWRQAVTPPDASAAMAEGASEMPEHVDSARRLRQCREGLTTASTRLPATREEAQKAMGLKREHDALAERLAASGLKPDILVFLQRARSDAGIPLNEVLTDELVIAWLKSKNRAAAFRVKTTAGALRFSR